jgi:cytochrome P450
VPCTYLAQRHPDYFEAPNEFRADRFVDKKPDPYAWIPFGGGARRCIGMAFALFEMRVVLATLLSRTEIVVPKKPARVALRSFMFAPKGGPKVMLQPRATTSTPSSRSVTSNESAGSAPST